MMRKSFRIAIWLIYAFGLIATAWTQYPSVPPDVQRAADAMLNEAKRLSDEAWKRALPIIEEQAKQGRPYIPSASRPEDLPQADLPAFPGAEGGGAHTPGGRGGRVLIVDSLADSGPGTLREACEQGGARIIVFNVVGIIDLQSPIIIRAPYITIAGQTAPGNGVCVAGESVWIDTHDVIIRHMRFRRGKTGVGRRDDALGGNPIGNIIIDHCSASWGLDENISMYRHMYDPGDGSKSKKLPTVNITFQNCISSEALDTYGHAFGSTIGGANCSFIRNLWADNTGRNPSIGMSGGFNFVNNVLFNWRHRTVDGGDNTSRYNIINNYYKPGPVTPKDAPVGHRILKPETGHSTGGRMVFGKAYVHGNVVEGNDAVTHDNWAGGVQVEDLPDAGKYLEDIRVDEPLPMTPVTTLSAEEAFKFVLDNAGATLPKRDAVDLRIIEQVRTGKIIYPAGLDPNSFYQFEHRRLGPDSYKQGIITDIKQVGGYPEYKGTPYQDADKDGMPDVWEVLYGLDPYAPADALLDCNGDGYTNIEKYLNGINPRKKLNWKDPKNNTDTLADRDIRLWNGISRYFSIDDPDPAYTRTITDRASDIVKNLGLADSTRIARVRDIVVQQYRNLNAIHNQRDKDIKASPESVADIRKHSDALTKQVHRNYLVRLSSVLTPEQVDKVKDGMTYGILSKTYRAYLDRVPELTESQKQQIMAFLVEARESAMDGGSSEEKHDIFRKYKGKINNYLSAQGHKLE